jgi:cytochrome c
MRSGRHGLAIVALIAGSQAVAAAGDPVAGERVFGTCKVCHQVGENAKNAVGPKQNGLLGRKAGTIEGFNYSEANKNSGIVWTEETLKEYLRDPRKMIPGTKMVFGGIKEDQKIDDLIAYLKQFGPDGKKM